MITATALKPNSHDRILILGNPPGASAMSAACAVALRHQRELHRVDLSSIVGKSLTATEKNIVELIGCAEEQNWILLFDEADRLFEKRTAVRDSHDRHAHVEVNYLLERLVRFRGIVVFTVHSDGPIDETLLLRFQRVIRPAPKLTSRALVR